LQVVSEVGEGGGVGGGTGIIPPSPIPEMEVTVSFASGNVIALIQSPSIEASFQGPSIQFKLAA
jgi:hypothetical protein